MKPLYTKKQQLNHKLHQLHRKNANEQGNNRLYIEQGINMKLEKETEQIHQNKIN